MIGLIKRIIHFDQPVKVEVTNVSVKVNSGAENFVLKYYASSMEARYTIHKDQETIVDSPIHSNGLTIVTVKGFSTGRYLLSVTDNGKEYLQYFTIH